MRHVRSVVACLTALLLLSGGLASGQGVTAKSGIDQKVVDRLTKEALSGKLSGPAGPLLQPDLGNCAVDPFEIREQGFRMAGGLGGLAFTDRPGTRLPALATALDQVARYEELAGAGDANDVAIMVADDFGSTPSAQLGKKIFSLPGADTSVSLGDLLDGLEASGEVSHGALVYQYTLALVDHLDGTVFKGFAPADPAHHLLQQAVFVRDAAGAGNAREIVVQAVDTRHYETSVIAAAINDALMRLPAQFGIYRAAINMSFAIVPCSVKENYEQSGAKGIDAYAASLLGAGYGTFRNELMKVLFTPVQQASLPDPLEYYLATGALPKGQQRMPPQSTTPHFPNMDAVVALASSGNDGLPFPYAPAMWPHVIAVGADYALTTLETTFSNTADIRTGGAWYRVEALVGTPGGGTRVADYAVVAGTSFASPGAAVFSALDLMRSRSRCWGSGESEPRLYTAGHTNHTLERSVRDRCHM